MGNEIVLYEPKVSDIKIRILPNLDEHLKSPRKDLYLVDYTNIIGGFNNLGKTSMNLSNIMNQMMDNLRPHNRRKHKIRKIFYV